MLRALVAVIFLVPVSLDPAAVEGLASIGQTPARGGWVAAAVPFGQVLQVDH